MKAGLFILRIFKFLGFSAKPVGIFSNATFLSIKRSEDQSREFKFAIEKFSSGIKK